MFRTLCTGANRAAGPATSTAASSTNTNNLSTFLKAFYFNKESGTQSLHTGRAGPKQGTPAPEDSRANRLASIGLAPGPYVSRTDDGDGA